MSTMPNMDADERTFRFLYAGATASHHSALFVLMVMTTIVGGGWGMLILVPFLVRRATRRLAIALFATFIVNATLVTVIKFLIGRPRPFVALADVRVLFGSPTGPSLPSGHATGSFCFAGFVVITAMRIAREKPNKTRGAWAASITAVFFATCVCISRVYLGAHFPSDVAAGALLGFAIGVGGAKAFESYERATSTKHEIDHAR